MKVVVFNKDHGFRKHIKGEVSDLKLSGSSEPDFGPNRSVIHGTLSQKGRDSTPTTT